jgi:outer membrane protein assembly factor BamD (BamD/ComL family)
MCLDPLRVATPQGGPRRRVRLPGGRRLAIAAALLGAVLAAGCAHWNTYYNANKSFREAEQGREDKLKEGVDAVQATAAQKSKYELALQKTQKILDEYPGSGLMDDALFLMAKAHYRLTAYRMSIAKLDLLFANFPQTPYEEEAIYIQALDYLGVGDLANSTMAIERLSTRFPESRFRAEALRVSAENKFTLKDWEGASTGFSDWLQNFPKGADADRIGYQLGEALFELKDYAAAGQRLETVLAATTRRELAFEARLLLARILPRLGRHDEAAREVTLLRGEAEVYKLRGDVALVEAEGLMAQGRVEEATPLLENMPLDWRTPTVAARAADLLGRIYLRQWKLDEAVKQLRDATRNTGVLYEPLETRHLADAVREFQAAEQALTSAKEDKQPAHKLNQANALLLGLGRPRQALALYLEVAGLAVRDSSIAARALYGAALVYRDSLAQADSAATLLARLQQEFPHSPQAFTVRTGAEGDLLGFLRAERERRALVAIDDNARGKPALTVPDVADTAAAWAPPAGAAVLTFVPPDSIGVAPAASVMPDSIGVAPAASAPADSVQPPGGQHP